MRIAFCGASGTGKTTLARHLAGALRLELNPTGSRSVAAAMGFENPYDVDRADGAVYDALTTQDDSPECAQRAAHSAMEAWRESDAGNYPSTLKGAVHSVRPRFQRNLQAAKIAWENAHEHFVTDRTTADDLAYCALHAVYSMDMDYVDRARQHLHGYDIIFFASVHEFQANAGDPARVAERAYHEVFELFVDGALVNWLGNEWNEKVFSLPSGNLYERAEFVERIHRQVLARNERFA